MKPKNSIFKIPNPEIILFLSLILYTNFIIISSLNCPANTWACNNGQQCINSTSRCNSVVDCSDGSDEGSSCSKFTNSIPLKMTIFLNLFLFHNKDSTCTIYEFKCTSVDQCIRKSYICDHGKSS